MIANEIQNELRGCALRISGILTQAALVLDHPEPGRVLNENERTALSRLSELLEPGNDSLTEVVLEGALVKYCTQTGQTGTHDGITDQARQLIRKASHEPAKVVDLLLGVNSILTTSITPPLQCTIS